MKSLEGMNLISEKSHFSHVKITLERIPSRIIGCVYLVLLLEEPNLILEVYN